MLFMGRSVRRQVGRYLRPVVQKAARVPPDIKRSMWETALAGALLASVQRWHLLAATPTSVLLALLLLANAAGAGAKLRWPGNSAAEISGRIAISTAGIAAVIYATGWGPMLAIGFLYSASENIRRSASRAIRPAMLASLCGLVAGQLSIVVGIAPTMVPPGQAHGLAVLSLVGLIFTIRIIGTATANEETAKRVETQTQGRFQEAKERFRTLFEASPLPIIAYDLAGRVELWNPAAEASFGWKAHEAVGRLNPITPDDQADDFRLIREVCAQSKGPVSFEAPRQAKNGARTDAVICAAPIHDPTGCVMGIMTVLVDNSERKQMLDHLVRETVRVNTLIRVAGQLNATLDLSAVVESVCEEAARVLRVPVATISLYNDARDEFVYAGGIGVPPEWAARLQVLPRATHDRFAHEEHRRTIVTPDVQALLELPNAAVYRALDVRTTVTTPIVRGSDLVGRLNIGTVGEQRTFSEDDLMLLRGIADQAAMAIVNSRLFERLQHANVELMLAYDSTLDGWSRALDLRDKETEGHTLRVTEATLHLARAMGVDEHDLVQIRRGALLHDIGKMGIPDAILFKPGPLTDEEWAIMRRHPDYAYQLLSSIAFLRPALNIPYCHHEKWDGTGYPRGLRGEQIPLGARIFAVIDVWDALRSDRPYRPAWPEERVREHIRSLAGTHLDPKVVEVFLSLKPLPRESVASWPPRSVKSTMHFPA